MLCWNIYLKYSNKREYEVIKRSLESLSCWAQMWFVFATSIEPGQPAHPCSLNRHYNVGWPTSSSHLDIPKMIINSSKEFQKVQGWIIKTWIKQVPRSSKRCLFIIMNLLDSKKKQVVLFLSTQMTLKNIYVENDFNPTCQTLLWHLTRNHVGVGFVSIIPTIMLTSTTTYIKKPNKLTTI